MCHTGQLDSALRENKMLAEDKQELKREIAKLNEKLKTKKAEMLKLQNSYETAFEEKLTNMQEYVKQLEDRLRRLTLNKSMTSSPDTATAVSPHGIYTLKSSLTYEVCPEKKMHPEPGTITDVEHLFHDVGMQKDEREGSLGGSPNGTEQDDEKQTVLQHNIDLQLSAITNLSAATLVLSSPHMDRFESLRYGFICILSGLLSTISTHPPSRLQFSPNIDARVSIYCIILNRYDNTQNFDHLDVEMSIRSEIGLTAQFEEQTNLKYVSKGPPKSSDFIEPMAAQSVTERKGHDYGENQCERRSHSSCQFQHRRRDFSSLQIAFDTCNPGLEQKQSETCNMLSPQEYRSSPTSAEKTFYPPINTATQQFEQDRVVQVRPAVLRSGSSIRDLLEVTKSHDIFSPSENAVREERHREREALLQSLHHKREPARRNDRWSVSPCKTQAERISNVVSIVCRLGCKFVSCKLIGV